jgi:hypothetical protein
MQARIALANTGLTALGMWGMQIPGATAGVNPKALPPIIASTTLL